jgi:hypothetical protein
VGSAALYVEEEYAWARFGGTLPKARRRGAQGAVLAQRIRDAHTMRARWITAWTTAETTDRPTPSRHNMFRRGFEPAYEIENYVRDFSP